MADYSRAKWVDPSLNWKPREVSELPERVLIDFATKCNLRCPMCPVWGSDDNEAIDSVVDHIWTTSVSGRDHGRPLGHGFEHDQTESLKERWENEQIVFVHFTQHAGMVQRWYPAMFARGRFQRATLVCGFAAEQRQLDRGL